MGYKQVRDDAFFERPERVYSGVGRYRTGVEGLLKAYRAGWEREPYVPFGRYTFPKGSKCNEVVLEAGAACPLPGGTMRRMEQCGFTSRVFYEHGGPGSWVQVYRCRTAWCDRCAENLAYRRALEINAKLPRMKGVPRFGTFTIPQVRGEDIGDMLRRLRKAYGKWMRWLKTVCRVHGSFYCVEIKASQTYDDSWHVHLHSIMDAGWFSYPDASESWHLLTGAHRMFPWWEKVDDMAGATRYVTKYVTKPYDETVTGDLEKLIAVMRARRDRVRLSAFCGEWRGLVAPVTEATKLEGVTLGGEWISLGSVEDAVRRGLAGDVLALRALDEWGFGDPRVVGSSLFER